MKKLVYTLITIIILLVVALGAAVWQIKRIEREQRERELQRKLEYTDSLISYFGEENIEDILGADMNTRIIYSCEYKDDGWYTVCGDKDTLYYDFTSGKIVELAWVIPDTQNN